MRKKLFTLFENSKAKGFTLIELLVVLGILGILAVAILAAINPIEQLNKAQDAAQENAATIFVSAVTQYYSVHNVLPWGTTTASVCGGSATFTNKTLYSFNTGTGNCIGKLIAEGELKQSFTNYNPNNLKNIIISVYGPSTTNPSYKTTACFKPQSKAVQADPNTKYSLLGVAGCTGASCAWCAQ